MRRVSWTVGELVHRDLADRLAPSGQAEPLPPADSEAVTPGHVPAGDLPRPFRSRPTDGNPVVTAADVDDYGDAEFVADPFLFPADGTWHLFFEVFNRDRRPTGVVGHATCDDGRSWSYDQVVLRDEVHLAFPYVFEWAGDYYMLPDRWDREDPAAIKLFRTDSLPGGWEPASTIVDPDRQLADCVVFRWDDRWWALLGSDDGRYDLWAYHADDLLEDEWTPHRDNPVVTGRPEGARPAGRPIVGDDGVLLFLQDCAGRYGEKVRAYDVETLTPTAYADRERPESPVLKGVGRPLGWNSGRMHHIDPWRTDDGWLCAVDGNVGFGGRLFGPDHWSVGLYRA